MELKLGKEKVVIISPWKGKAKKEFIKIFKDKKDNVSGDDVVDILLYPYIEPKDVYYSPDEIKWILTNIRAISIEDKIEFEINCDNCNEPIVVERDILDMVNYQENQYPVTDGDFTWRDLPNKNSVLNTTKKYPDDSPVEIEKILHISHYKEKEIKSFADVLDISDDLTFKDADIMLDSYNKNRSKTTISCKIICDDIGCFYESVYNFDVVPTFFDPMLPKK